MAVVVSGGEVVAVNRSAFASFAPSISGALPSYGGTVQSYGELYRRQPNVRLVVRFLGRNIAQLGLKAFERVDDAERRALPKDHELVRWIKSPTPVSKVKVTRHRWIRALVEDLAIYDMSLHLKMRNPADRTFSAVRIPPTNFLPMGDSWLWPDFFRVFGARGHKDYLPEDVIYFSGHNPLDPKTGCSPLEALRRVLAEEVAAGEYREQFWKGAGRQSGWIERPLDAPKWSPTAKTRFEEELAAQHSGSGPGAGRTGVLEEGMTYKATSFSSKDSEYLGARILSRAEVAAQYFIPPVFVGILENANFANVREQHRSLYSDTLGPWLDWITEDLEAQLVPEFEGVDDVYLDFNIAAKLEGSFEEKAAAMQSATGAPWMTRDEARALDNRPPLPDGLGAEIVTPLNVLVGGLASPRDTAPTETPAPGTLALPAGARGVKAVGLEPALRGWEAKHAEVLAGFFGRQRDSVLSKLGAGLELEVAFDAGRWNAELRNDLFALALTMADDVGTSTASDLGGDFDRARVEAWLAENSRIAAEGINSATFGALGEVWSGVPRRGTLSSDPAGAKDELTAALLEAGLVDESDDEDLPEDPFGESFLDPARGVFAAAIAARAIQIATSRTTTVGQFSRAEGAAQAGAGTKTWRSSGLPNSRHADLDGETVPIGELFSNGAQWPGDPALGVDETAGCACSLDFGS